MTAYEYIQRMGLASAAPADPASGDGKTGSRGWIKKIIDSVAFRATLVIGASVGGYYLLPVDRHAFHLDGTQGVGRFIVALVLLAALITRQIRAHLFKSTGKVRAESFVLLFGLAIDLFAVTYLRMADQVDGLHTKTDSLYFTLSTMATVGFGDVHATGQAARGVVIAQILFDLVFIAAAGSLVNAAFGARLAELRNKRG